MRGIAGAGAPFGHPEDAAEHYDGERHRERRDEDWPRGLLERNLEDAPVGVVPHQLEDPKEPQQRRRRAQRRGKVSVAAR